MRRSAPPSVLSILLTLALAACTDRDPTSAPEIPRQPELPPPAVAMMMCTVSVGAGTLACDGAAVGDGASAAIIGGQGVYVRLRSFGGSFDAATGTLRTNVTVENLTSQALGTADGVTPSADGVRIFFHRGPTATEGTGNVTVANADGEGVFLSAGQKYFQYEGILAPGDTSAAKEWRFTLESGVGAFSFGVYVAAPVRAEGGFVSVTPVAPSLVVGDTQRITPTVRNVAGGAVAGAPVTWGTSDPAVATVDAQGLVTAVRAGTASVTATSGGRTASVEVQVHADSQWAHPTLVSFAVLGPSVDAGEADTVAFDLRLRGVRQPPFMQVYASNHRGYGRQSCLANGPVSWAGPLDGTYRCIVVFSGGWRRDAWRVDSLAVGEGSLVRKVVYDALLAAGAPAHLYVGSPVEDRTAPTLEDLDVLPRTIRPGGELHIAVTGRDTGVGIDHAAVFLSIASWNGLPTPGVGCTTAAVPNHGTPYLGTYECRIIMPEAFADNTMLLDSVILRDQNGNRRATFTAELKRLQFPAWVCVTDMDGRLYEPCETTPTPPWP